MVYIETEEHAETAAERARARKAGRRIFYTRLTGILTLIFIVLVTILVILLILRVPVGSNVPPMNVVGVEEFSVALQESTDPVIFDIRDKRSFESSRIEDAQWGEKKRCLEYGVETCTRKVCSKRQSYFFYSDHGEEYHEVRNAIERTNSRNCWTEVWLLEGGIDDWIDAGLPVVN